MAFQPLMQIQANRDGVVSRRTFLRNLAAGSVGLGMLGWKEAVAMQAPELHRRGMSCILMFMQGGPSQLETFDPKPGSTNGGPTQAIDTSVPGIRIAESWPNVARQMGHIALIRSMNSREGEHQRASYQMHTGYIPAGGVSFPTLGSLVSSEIAPQEFDLPHFVQIGGGRLGSGFLGMNYAPFLVPNPAQLPNNVQLPGNVNGARFERRLNLMRDLERDFAESGGGDRVRDHGILYGNAANMVRSPRLQAFDLSREPTNIRDRYGRTTFGQSCLLARRLVETGVTFVEIGVNGWDTHQDNFNRSKTLSEGVDPGFAALVRDLHERGRLDRTLVIWMGQFGRTPRINANTGRDHFPRAFSVALAGAGIRGGQVIGATSPSGTDIIRRPVGVADLFCSFCHALGIDPRKENITPIGRPIKIVDGGERVRELFA